MDIVKTVKVPRRFIYDKIMDSVKLDIEKQTGKHPKHLSGFSYVKQFSQNRQGRITIDEVTEPAIYAFTTSTNKAVWHTRWELLQIDDDLTSVTISEQQESKGFLQKINDSVTGIALGWIKRRQMLAILDAISKQYHGQS